MKRIALEEKEKNRMMISCHWNRLVKVKVISAKKFFKVNKKDKKIPLEDDTE